VGLEKKEFRTRISFNESTRKENADTKKALAVPGEKI